METNLNVPTVTSALKHLAKPGITCDTFAGNLGRVYGFDKYSKTLNERTEPLD